MPSMMSQETPRTPRDPRTSPLSVGSRRRILKTFGMRFSAGIGLTLLFLTSAAAHHVVLAKFDEDRPITLVGTVTEVSWANPHVHVFVNAKAGTAPLVNWAVELESPALLERSGWRPDTLKPGSSIWVDGIAARDGSKQAWGFAVLRADTGERLFVVDEHALETRLSAQANGETPRWPDGQPRLGPPPGQTGYWTGPSLSALVENGVRVEMDAHGLLRDLGDAGRVAPFRQWAKDLYVLRQRNFLKDDPTYLYCIPPSGPRQFQMPYPFGVQFVEDRARGRIFVLMGGGNSNWRLIHVSGESQGRSANEESQQGGDEADESKALFYGRSTAHWQGDTLSITSTGFNESFWFSNGGLPHTAQLRLVERISRPDLNTLRYEVSVVDPGAYTRPWTSSWTLHWVQGEELPPTYCQDNRP